jgi:hypothetical protein
VATDNMMMVMMMVMVVLMMMMMDDCDFGFVVASAHTSSYCGSTQSATRCNKAADYNNYGPLPANLIHGTENTSGSD